MSGSFSDRVPGDWSGVHVTLGRDPGILKVRSHQGLWGLFLVPEREVLTPAIWEYVATGILVTDGVMIVNDLEDSLRRLYMDRSGLALDRDLRS